ncbi:hypothetical protein GCM10025875_04170 [Litorihabitans aurantiacus]|uniref:Uncharacterized protein n=1 Tax=Litorihabitans aurantiacus TaxID=1930061 RepID=A0AA37US80_9MICO|nr:hypothetical protein GCM10025875_04170 [Litorihabitans aurantiacus]
MRAPDECDKFLSRLARMIDLDDVNPPSADGYSRYRRICDCPDGSGHLEEDLMRLSLAQVYALSTPEGLRRNGATPEECSDRRTIGAGIGGRRGRDGARDGARHERRRV